jgi:hypothetical protein
MEIPGTVPDAFLLGLKENLDQANCMKLAHAIQQAVAAIAIGVREAATGEITHTEIGCELWFYEAVCVAETVEISDDGRRPGASSAFWPGSRNARYVWPTSST